MLAVWSRDEPDVLLLAAISVGMWGWPIALGHYPIRKTASESYSQAVQYNLWTHSDSAHCVLHGQGPMLQ